MSADLMGPATLDPPNLASAARTAGPTPRGPTEGTPNLRCSFCGERHQDVAHMVKGRGSALICDGCVEAAGLVIAAARDASLAIPPLPAGARR